MVGRSGGGRRGAVRVRDGCDGEGEKEKVKEKEKEKEATPERGLASWPW